jgi:hypothetical protein
MQVSARKLWAILPILFLAAFTNVSRADVVLWDNGSLVTHPGAGPDGVDVSMASLIPNTAGSNVTATLWRADNFAVTGPGWLVDFIETFAYDTNNPVPRFQSATINIHSDSGGTPGAILTSANATWGYSGINRIFNGEANLGNTARQVQRITANFNGYELSAGNYFFSFSVTNSDGVNNWFPFVMDINPADSNDPITRVGNSYISSDSGGTWALSNVSTGGWNQSPDIAFLVRGTAVPEPSSCLMLFAATTSLLVRRRR